MNKLEFSNAPVSEVILGITFEKNIIDLDKIFEFSQLVTEEYPIFEIKPPLADQRLEDFKIITETDNQKTGPFRVFQRSLDKRFLIQYQSNKLIFNWIRKDDQSVGNYPGFTHIKDRFDSILNIFLGLQKNKINIDHFELTYQDRVEWEKYINSLNDVSRVMHLSPPPVVSDLKINNIISTYTYHLPQLNGYCKLDITSNTALNEKQILKFQNTFRGSDSLEKKDIWFDTAHELQIEAFKKIFKTEVLDQWK